MVSASLIERFEMTKKQKLLDQIYNYEDERRESTRLRIEREDQEWAAWIDTPEALVEIIKDPGLTVRPSDRVYTGRDILDLIKKGRNHVPGAFGRSNEQGELE